MSLLDTIEAAVLEGLAQHRRAKAWRAISNDPPPTPGTAHDPKSSPFAVRMAALSTKNKKART